MSPGNKSAEERLQALEKDSHEPYDFTELVKRIEALERALERYVNQLETVSKSVLGTIKERRG